MAASSSEEKYWASVSVDPFTECHDYVGGKRLQRAREDSWRLWKSSALPRYMAPKCGNEKCVSPHHLEGADRLCRSRQHPLTPTNTRPGSSDLRCAACSADRPCRRCGRKIEGENARPVVDSASSCLFCHSVLAATKRAKYTKRVFVSGPEGIELQVVRVRCHHSHTDYDTLVETRQGWRCSLCLADRVCPKGHRLEGNVFKHKINARGPGSAPRPVTAERCLTCHKLRFPDTCANGHDLTDPANTYVTPGSGSRCCRPCRDAHQRATRTERPRKLSFEYRRAVSHTRRLQYERLKRENPEEFRAQLDDARDRFRLARAVDYLIQGRLEQFNQSRQACPSRRLEDLASFIEQHGSVFSTIKSPEA